MTAVSMGNPHAVIYVDDVAAFPLESLGPRLEHHPAFPRRVNVHVVEVLGPRRGQDADLGARLGDHPGLRHRGLRRLRRRRAHGADRTARSSRICRAATSSCPGLSTGRPIFMTGPATEVFSGDWPD